MCKNPTYPTTSNPNRSHETASLGIKTVNDSPSADFVRRIRQQRYELSRVSRAILANQGEKMGMKYVLDYHRSCKCQYIPFGAVQVQKSVEHKKCFYTGVMKCGNVWVCPNCSTRIQEVRRAEIAHAINYIYDTLDKQCCMVTFTFSHSRTDKLKDLFKKQQQAISKMTQSKAFQKLGEVFGYDGAIRSLEVTWGENAGFHPHTHELWAIDKVRKIDKLALELYLFSKYRAKKHHYIRDKLLKMDVMSIFKHLILERWEDACKKVGLMDGVNLKDFRRYAVDVKPEVSCSEYLAKIDDSRNWGADSELSRASSKSENKRPDSMHPFMFLTKFNETSDGIWAARWLEYVHATRRKRQIRWSNDLKKRAGIAEMTDEQIIEMQEDTAFPVYEPNDLEWKKIRSGYQAKLLDICEDTNNKNEIGNFIQKLPIKPEIKIRTEINYHHQEIEFLKLQTEKSSVSELEKELSSFALALLFQKSNVPSQTLKNPKIPEKKINYQLTFDDLPVIDFACFDDHELPI